MRFVVKVCQTRRVFWNCFRAITKCGVAFVFADGLRDKIPVIATCHPISDKLAELFSLGFYERIFEGCSVRDAYEEGKLAVRIDTDEFLQGTSCTAQLAALHAENEFCR